MATRNSTERTEIQSGTRVTGRVEGSEDVLVAGRLEGSVALEGTLTVDNGGVVKADVRAQRVVVAGTVVGDVTASGAIEIAASGRVKGDLRAPVVRIDDGARLSGLLEVGEVEAVEVAPRPARARAETPAAPVAGFVPAAPAQEERRRKRVVVKKRS